VKIYMFVKNSFEYDARVTKEAKTLIGAGHEVTVVALYTPDVTPLEETTADGIHVLRVPRSSFGIPTLNRLAQKYAGSIEARHVKLTGDAYNEETVRQLGRLSAPSTAAPEATTETPQVVQPPAERPGPYKRLWGSFTTPVLRSFARFARWSFSLAKGLLGQQSQWIKHRAIDSRMIAIGAGSDADIFHCHDLNTLRIGTTLKQKTGALLVYDSHELQTERSRMTDKSRATAVNEEGGALPHVDAMIVASPSWIPWNTKLYGQLPDPTVTLINVPEPTTVDPSLDLREALDIAADQFVVIYQGSIQENRGIEPGIDAVAMLDAVTLVIIGYGYHRPALEDMVRNTGLESKVLFFGPVPNDELISYSASADIGLANIVGQSVSYETSLPNKLFEYAMAGIPVIGSDSPEIGRIIKETGIGLTCDPEDAEAIAEAIETIRKDPEPYKDATRPAAERYNWVVESQVLLNVYSSLTST
jgi:glycosyltransferase involved in cell wall biosynthesis